MFSRPKESEKALKIPPEKRKRSINSGKCNVKVVKDGDQDQDGMALDAVDDTGT